MTLSRISLSIEVAALPVIPFNPSLNLWFFPYPVPVSKKRKLGAVPSCDCTSRRRPLLELLALYKFLVVRVCTESTPLHYWLKRLHIPSICHCDVSASADMVCWSPTPSIQCSFQWEVFAAQVHSFRCSVWPKLREYRCRTGNSSSVQIWLRAQRRNHQPHQTQPFPGSVHGQMARSAWHKKIQCVNYEFKDTKVCELQHSCRGAIQKTILMRCSFSPSSKLRLGYCSTSLVAAKFCRKPSWSDQVE